MRQNCQICESTYNDFSGGNATAFPPWHVTCPICCVVWHAFYSPECEPYWTNYEKGEAPCHDCEKKRRIARMEEEGRRQVGAYI
jgi:hypothetical protein